MDVKISGFVISVEAITYLLLYNLHEQNLYNLKTKSADFLNNANILDIDFAYCMNDQLLSFYVLIFCLKPAKESIFLISKGNISQI